MKAIVGLLLALSLVAGHSEAASQQQKKRLKAAQQSKSYAAKTRGDRKPAPSDTSASSDYYEHLLEKVPFGSKRWWSVYDEQQGPPQ